MSNQDNGSVGQEDDENGRSLRIHCTYVREGEIVLEQSEYFDRKKMSIDELIARAKRFEELDMELFEMRISFDQEDD